ncbi:MAG: hypothetical protein RIM72_14895 [Alphaproteobacteria bacterium]
MPKGARPFFCALAALLAVFNAVGVQASSIDGAWCGPSGDRIVIDGKSVTTPGGQSATGKDKGRAFRFTLPDGEAGAGTEFWLEPEPDGRLRVSRLRDSTIGPPPHDAWTRCDPVS